MSSRNEAILHCPRPGCDYRTLDSSNLKRHRVHHDPSKWRTCSEPGCTYSSVDSSNFRKHLLKHDPEKLKRYEDRLKVITCLEPGCTYKSVDSSNFKRHRLTHYPEELEKDHDPSKWFTCLEPDCHYRSVYWKHFDRHRLQQHEHGHQELQTSGNKARRKTRPFVEPGRGYTLTSKQRRNKRTVNIHVAEPTQVTRPLVKTRTGFSKNYEALKEPAQIEDPDCNFCNYAKRLPRYLRIHLEPCVKCTSKNEISNRSDAQGDQKTIVTMDTSVKADSLANQMRCSDILSNTENWM